MASKNEEALINSYGVQMEEEQNVNVEEPVEVQVSEVPVKEVQPMAEAARENRLRGRADIPVTGDAGLKYKDNLGWLMIDPKSLPTQCMYYPEDIEIRIRAARGEEIKHWSTMNDQDLQQLAYVDDILSYMIERCCTVKIGNRPGNCWRDLKNVDRMYILLSIREFTFLDGENELLVPISENEDIPVTKEMIDFVEFPEDVMKFYKPDQKCFVFNINGNQLRMHIPSIGVNAWLTTYARQKEANNEFYDKDFLLYAPMLIADYRDLTVRAYEDMVSAARHWGAKEWSVISYVTNALGNATVPKVKYKKENGEEAEVPLSFRGGLKAIFLLPNPLLTIC